MDTPEETITPQDGTSERRTGWKNALITMVGPAFYTTSWAPWVRIVVTAMLVYVAVLIWIWLK